MVIEDGFPGQHLFVLPRPLLQRSLGRPGTAHLIVTDCGYFPRALAHGITRDVPVPQAVVILCTDGLGWCRIDGVTHAIGPGQVVVIRPDASHAYGSDPHNPWTLWWMHLDGRDLHELLDLSGPGPVQTLHDVYRAVALLEEIVRLMEEDVSQASLFAAAGAAWHFLAVLASSAARGGSRASVVEQAKSYLQNHLGDRVSVNDLAMMARLSVSHFAALFRSQVGLPVLQYQTQLRMARARELLDTSDLSVAQIAVETGYADADYFSRQFRSVHGTTALRYRAQSKG